MSKTSLTRQVAVRVWSRKVRDRATSSDLNPLKRPCGVTDAPRYMPFSWAFQCSPIVNDAKPLRLPVHPEASLAASASPTLLARW